jgi:hypothetical protein
LLPGLLAGGPRLRKELLETLHVSEATSAAPSNG